MTIATTKNKKHPLSQRPQERGHQDKICKTWSTNFKYQKMRMRTPTFAHLY